MHSELIQGWIAGSLTEPRQLQQARSYLYDLKLEEALEDVEDAAELVYYMHRLSYPAGSHLEARVRGFLTSHAGQVSRDHLLEIGRRLTEQPDSGPLWSRVVFEQSWFTDRVAKLLEGLTLEEHVTLCTAFWRSLFSTPQSRLSRQATSGAAVAVSQQLALVTVQRIERNGDGQAVCLCAQLGVPLQEESLVVLRKHLLSTTRGGVLHSAQVLSVAEAFLSHHLLDAEWLDALQAAMCEKSFDDVEASHAVGLFRALAMMRSAPPSAAFEKLLVRLLPDMSSELILDCCGSLTRFPNSVSRLREGLRERLLFEMTQSDDKNNVLLWQLRGMTLIAPTEAIVMLARFVERVKNTETVLPASATQTLVRCMRDLRTFPPEVVLHCKKSFLHNTPLSFTQRDSAYLLYAAAQAGEPANGAFFKEAVNRFTTTRNFNRRKHGAHQRNILSLETVMMVLEAFNMVKGGRLSNEPKVYAVVRDVIEQQQQQNKITVNNAIDILTLLVKLKVDDAPLTTSLLTRVSKSITFMTPAHVKSLCEVLVALKSRDVLMFRALLSHLAHTSPDHEGVTSTALTARRLKFVPYFQQSALVGHVTSLNGWNLSNVVLVASACSEKQREALLALPGAEILSQARPEEMTTFDLFLLLSITNSGKDKTSAMAAVLKSRPPLAAGELEVEDVWRALVKVLDDKEALAAVCRSGAATMQTVDENMLMRFLEAVSGAPDLPNTFFRVVGKAVLRLANSMAIENASRWLQLYVRYQIRDDSVGKALLAKVRTRSSNVASLVDKTIREASIMYGKFYTTQGKAKKQQDKVEWYSVGPV